MPSPIPAPLPPWARTLVQVLPGIAAGLQFALDYLGVIGAADDPDPGAWVHVQHVFEDATDADNANRAVYGIDVVNITGGEVDSSWTQADFDTVDTHLAAIVTAYLPYLQSRIRHLERRYYLRHFNPMSMSDPFAPSGPPAHIVQDLRNGTDAGLLPPQCSMTVTEKTAYPRHWGRMYLPFPGHGTVGVKGTITNTVVDAVLTQVQNRYDALQNAEFFPVVPVTVVQGAPTRGLLTVDQVQVDNVFDVIRRRRTHTTTYRNAGPL